MEKTLRPTSLPQALSLRRSTGAIPLMYGDAGYSAGAEAVLQLRECEEFRRMDTDGKLVHIGAGVTAAQLCRDKLTPALLRTAAELCPREKRERVSLGGAICAGDPLCIAALGALDAWVTVASETGRRTMKLRRFLRKGVSLARDELLCEILVPDRKGGCACCERCGEELVFCGFVRWDHRRVSELRLAFSGGDGKLVRFEELENKLLGVSAKEAKELRTPLTDAYRRYLPPWEETARNTLLVHLGSFLADNNM